MQSSVAAPKTSSIFWGKFCQNFSPEVWIFPKFWHNIQNFDKYCNFKILTKMKTSENTVYVIWGGRKIAQEAGKILPQVSQKL